MYWLPKQSLCLFFNSLACLTSWQSFQISTSQSWSYQAVHCSVCMLEEGASAAACPSGAGCRILLPARVHSLPSLTAKRHRASLVFEGWVHIAVDDRKVYLHKWSKRQDPAQNSVQVLSSLSSGLYNLSPKEL